MTGRPRLALAGALVVWGVARAALAQPADDRFTYDLATATWTVAPNGTSVVDAEVIIRAPTNNLSRVVAVPIVWSGAVEKLTVTEARLDKHDGRKIVLGPSAIRDDPFTGDAFFHEFSDQRRLVITFADAEADDLLVIDTKREVFRPFVPGGFSTAMVLDSGVGWTDTSFAINVPPGVPLLVDTNGFDHHSEILNNRNVWYFRSQKDLPPSRDVAVLGDFDRLPRFVASTFRDWDQFAKAYASLLLPHAKVTPAIDAMAAKLTQGQPSPREKARLLYEWVRDNVRFIPVLLDEGRPEPNDAEQVMTKSYGDAKDHAVLLYALLSALHIPADIVLLNATNSATIPDAPAMRPMNHLILYLPRFDVWIDSTSGVAPFGVLPFNELGKPAIHLGGFGPVRGVVPIPPSSETRVDMKTEERLDENGDVTGFTTTTARGAFGIWLRSTVRSVGEGKDASIAAAATMLLDRRTPGTGELFFDKPDSAAQDYTVNGSFRLENQSALLRGGYFSPWTGLRMLPRPGDILAGPLQLRSNQPTFCYPGIQREEIVLTIPEGRELSRLPEDSAIDTDMVNFRSHWSLAGRRATVTRTFESIAPGPVCEGPVREKMAAALTKIRADLNNTVGLRVNKIDPAPPPPDNPDDDRKD